MEIAASVVVRDIAPGDRLRWQPLWQAYQPPRKIIPDEITDTT
jgi:hypothetical protein